MTAFVLLRVRFRQTLADRLSHRRIRGLGLMMPQWTCRTRAEAVSAATMRVRLLHADNPFVHIMREGIEG
jgi:hypothetical protein